MDGAQDSTRLNPAQAGLVRKSANQIANNALFSGDF